MASGFVVRKQRKAGRKEGDMAVTTIRMEKELQEQFDELAKKSGYSRNELMCMALRYAMEHLEFEADGE